MAIKANGSARIQHHTTAIEYVITPDELDWQQIGADERGMGIEVTHEAAIKHPQLGLLTWTVSEYPSGFLNQVQTDPGPHTLLSDFEIDVETPERDSNTDEALINEMVEWFFERYENPAYSLPYNSSEGGYLWVDGGPYDAAEEIGGNFSAYPDELIDEAVERVQSDGTFEWSARNRDQEDSYVEDFADLGTYADQSGDLEDTIDSVFSDIPNTDVGPLFDVSDQGLVDLVAWNGALETGSEILEVICAHANALVSDLEGTNAHQDILTALMNYRAAAASENLSITRLYTEGVFLESTLDQVNAELANGDRPPLPGAVPASLQTLLQLHGTWIMSTPEGAALVDASNSYTRRPHEQQGLNEAISLLAGAIAAAPEVFAPGAIALADRASAQVGKGRHPARSNQVAVMIMKGLIEGAGKLIAPAATLIAGGIIVDGTIASGIGTQATAAVSGAVDFAWAILVNHVDAIRVVAAAAGPEATWINRFANWAQRR